MTDPLIVLPATISVVLADANVLYSRSLRDYLLYAAEQEIVNVRWSQAILDDVTQHLTANLPNFDQAAACHLVSLMEDTFPLAKVEPSQRDFSRLESITLPDEDDRSVIAAAIAADATIICTNNLKHFPAVVLHRFNMLAVPPDDLFTQLIYTHMAEMVAAHRAVVAAFPRATDESTLSALRRARAFKTADLMASCLGLSDTPSQ